jgi:hypothetical protein
MGSAIVQEMGDGLGGGSGTLRFQVSKALWLKCMVSVPVVVCGRLPWVRWLPSLAVAWIQSVASGLERSGVVRTQQKHLWRGR